MPLKYSIMVDSGYLIFVDEIARTISVQVGDSDIAIGDAEEGCTSWGETCTNLAIPEEADYDWGLKGVVDYLLTRERLVSLETHACEVGYLDEWGGSRNQQEILIRNGICVIVDTIDWEVGLDQVQPYPECPTWCVCGPKGKCWYSGNECRECAAAPSPGISLREAMTSTVNSLVETLVKRNDLR